MQALIVSQDPARLAEMAKAITGTDSISSVQTHAGTLRGQPVLPAKAEVDLLILDCTVDPGESLDELERLSRLYPTLNVVLVIAQESSELLLRALRAGVREIVTMPFEKGDLVAAIRRIGQRHQGVGRAPGKVVAFISCKGGSGATFIAANLGYALAAKFDKRVLLIDLNLQFGDAALFISDRRPPSTLAEIARDIGRLDLSLLESSTINPLPGFGVIAAPDDPTLVGEIKPAQVETLIRFARTHFDFVLLDVGRSLDAIAVQALDMADQVHPVFQLTLPFIRDGKRLLSLFASLNYPKDKIRPIVNRYERSNDLTVPDLEKAVACKVFATIPNHYESVAASVNQGVPIQKLHRNSPVSKALLDLAEKIVHPPQQGERGWLDRLFGRAAA